MIEYTANNTLIEHKIIAVSVTYGDRWHHLLQVIPAAFTQIIVDALVIVDNASNYDLVAKIRDTFPQFEDRITILTQAENLGSAGGFSLGLKKAYDLLADFVYLLDDDNLPEDHAVLELYRAWCTLNTKCPSALLSFRYRNLPNLQKAAYGLEVRYFRDKPNSFLGFSLWSALVRRINAKSKSGTLPSLLPRIEIKQAPYGGLFLPRATISEIGFPNEQLYLYADDTEYTNRIIHRGGKIWMITASKLMDLEGSWWSDANVLQKKWSEPLLEEGGFKAYYSARNLTWFLWRNLSPNPIFFLLNGFIYLSYLFLIAIISKKIKAFVLILVAVKDGLLGNLGRNNKIDTRR